PGDPLTTHHEDVASSLQRVLEEQYLHLVTTLWERTGIPRIALAGGVALNAVANGRVIAETPFTEVYVQPAAGDSGTAAGAAFDPRRSRHLGRDRQAQRARQAPRAVPAVRAVRARGTSRRVVRAGLPVAVHGARLQDAGGQARAGPRGQSRRRHRARAVGR